jgi:maltose alpha-D-glucosyltransferase/alpha-amylase
MYYGDEIGMGDNVYLGDRNGVRTPMQWSSDRNSGFSRADSAALYAPLISDPVFGYQGLNVEAQERVRSSLLNWVKRLVRIRQKHPTFALGKLEFLNCSNMKVLCFIRRYEQETMLVVCNLSRFAQPAELELGAFEGQSPVELFGNTPFPAIRAGTYQLALGPYMFLWFRLEKAAPKEAK